MTDFWDLLTEKQKASIAKGIQQLNEGKRYSARAVLEEIKAKRKKN